MKKGLISVLCVVIALVLIAGCGVLYFINTPEYALAKICTDIKEIGFDAVLPNLTDEAYKKVEPVIKIVNNNIVQSILSFISDNDYASVLIDKASEVEWSVGDILKNNKKASVTIAFNYDDKIIGSIDLELKKIDGKWKINDLYNLNIEELSLHSFQH